MSSKIAQKFLRTIPVHMTLLLMTMMLSSCMQPGGTGSQDTTSAQPVISIMAPLHFPKPPTSELIQEIEKLTGTKLDINLIPDGIYTDKMNTALTTNSLKKVTFVKHTDYILMKNAIRTDAFWEIGPYLQEFKNLSQLNPSILEQSSVDGRIYGLYTERPSSRQGAIIREDWLNKLGLEPPSTLDELYEVLYRFTYEDPDGNGIQDTIGIADRNDLVFGAFKTLGSYMGTPNNWLLEEGKFIPEFETEAYFQTMDYMKKLYEEKLINLDFAVTSKELQRNMVIRGTAGVYIGSLTDVQRLSDETKAINPDASFTMVNRIAGPMGPRVWSIPNYNGLYLFSKKAIKTEEELKQVLAFFDRTMDEDVANLMKYGIEGRHYTMVNGLVYLPEETSQLRVNEVNAFYTLMIADMSNPNILKIAGKEALTSEAERLIEDNDNFLVADPTIHLESKTYDEISNNLNRIITDATYNYILGNLTEDGFKQEVKKWRNSGGDQIIKEYEEAYAKQNN